MRKFTYQTRLEHHPDTSEPIPGKVPGKTVLIVEDEPLLLKVIRTFLVLEGIGVLTAATEDEAVAVAKASPGKIDLLLADIRLPQGSGPGVARRLRETHPDTKVVFMSGFSKEDMIEEGRIGRNDQFLPKPFDAKSFRNTLRSLVLGD